MGARHSGGGGEGPPSISFNLGPHFVIELLLLAFATSPSVPVVPVE